MCAGLEATVSSIIYSVVPWGIVNKFNSTVFAIVKRISSSAAIPLLGISISH